MQNTEMGEVLAQRTLHRTDDPAAKILVKVGKTQPTSGYNDFFCLSQIVGIGDERIDATYGVDAFQAIQLAIKYIASKLDRLNEHYGKTIRWEGDDQGGFGF